MALIKANHKQCEQRRVEKKTPDDENDQGGKTLRKTQQAGAQEEAESL